MPGACRRTDIHYNPSDSCGCGACPHAVSGPAITGSPNVFANNLGGLRANGIDIGVHCCCCGPNIWGTMQGSPNVFLNNYPFVRLNDITWCCGGTGSMITCSPNVIING